MPPSSLTPKPLNILSLDGGGVYGVSSLLILHEIMTPLLQEASVLPCQVFDLITGTGTGGLIALMLGRLRMSIDECIEAYIELSKDVFGKRKPLAMARKLLGKSTYDHTALVGKVEKLVEKHSGGSKTMQDPRGDRCCRTFVLAANSDHTGPPRLFRTYISNEKEPHDDCQIWEAARATMAASTFFDSITIGNPPDEFINDTLGTHNNPSFIAIGEASSIWPRRSTSLHLSLGTGTGSATVLSGNAWSILQECQKIATDCNAMHDFVSTHYDMQRFNNPLDPYYRFSVDQGLESIGLDECKDVTKMTNVTRAYIRERRRDSEAVGQILIARIDDVVQGAGRVAEPEMVGLTEASETAKAQTVDEAERERVVGGSADKATEQSSEEETTAVGQSTRHGLGKVAEPVVDQATMPAIEQAKDQTGEENVEGACESTDQPTGDAEGSAEQPTEQIIEATTDSATDHPTERATDEATEDAPKQSAEPAGQPTEHTADSSTGEAAEQANVLPTEGAAEVVDESEVAVDESEAVVDESEAAVDESEATAERLMGQVLAITTVPATAHAADQALPEEQTSENATERAEAPERAASLTREQEQEQTADQSTNEETVERAEPEVGGQMAGETAEHVTDDAQAMIEQATVEEVAPETTGRTATEAAVESSPEQANDEKIVLAAEPSTESQAGHQPEHPTELVTIDGGMEHCATDQDTEVVDSGKPKDVTKGDATGVTEQAAEQPMGEAEATATPSMEQVAEATPGQTTDSEDGATRANEQVENVVEHPPRHTADEATGLARRPSAEETAIEATDASPQL